MREAELFTLTACEASGRIADGTLSAETYVAACLERIGALDREIGAFVHLDPDYALAQARARDEWRRQGRPLGPLHGVPVAIKDIFDTADYPTECGTPILAGRRPRTDATVVRKLREAGAVIIGKTVTTEFAYYHPGKTRNPRNPNHTPGGSSSGSAAAVAAQMVPLAIGSQTNGSVIRPAAFCGVFGVKPSRGLVSRAGALPLSRTLDHVGAFARSLDDLALILDVLVGSDSADPDTEPFPARNFRPRAVEPPTAAPRLAFVRTPVWDKADPEARAALEDAARRLRAREIDLPGDCRAAWDDHRAIMAAEMAFNLGKFVDRGGEVSQRFRDLIAEGYKVTAAHYLGAVRDAQRHAQAVARIFDDGIDAIITLSAPGTAPLGIDTTGDPAFCTFWTLVGVPSLNLPLVDGANGLPIGVQLCGAFRHDAPLLRTAHAVAAVLARA